MQIDQTVLLLKRRVVGNLVYKNQERRKFSVIEEKKLDRALHESSFPFSFTAFNALVMRCTREAIMSSS